jgi:hypothetical protein
MLETLTFETMHALIGTSMFMDPEKDHRVELQIVEVMPVMESEAAKLKRKAFSIFFLGPKSYQVKQGTYPTQHAAFPEPFWLFVVPIREIPEGYIYEAVFT